MSDRPPKAPNMLWVNNYIIVSDIEAAVKFYQEVFGFELITALKDDNGNINHAELKYKDAVIMMGQENKKINMLSTKSLKGSPVSFYLYVDNVDDYFNKLKSAGVTVKDELTDQFWGDRTCSFICPEGLQWTFGQNVADFNPTNSNS